MLCSAVEKRRTDLDALTEDQRADIDRLLMIVWKTKPADCSVKRVYFEERHYPDEPGEYFCHDFRQVCGL
jgi:hypothetical protein